MAKKILLVEDDPFLIDIYTMKFEQSGYTVEVASDGEEGLQKAQSGDPAIILLDIVLPKMEGLELLKQLKNGAKTKDVPVVILSNLGGQEQLERAQELGAYDYLVKSQYTPSEVVAHIKSILDTGEK